MHVLDSHELLEVYGVCESPNSLSVSKINIYSVRYVIWSLRINVDGVRHLESSLPFPCTNTHISPPPSDDMASVMVASPFSCKVQRIKYVLYQFFLIPFTTF